MCYSRTETILVFRVFLVCFVENCSTTLDGDIDQDGWSPAAPVKHPYSGDTASTMSPARIPVDLPLPKWGAHITGGSDCSPHSTSSHKSASSQSASSYSSASPHSLSTHASASSHSLSSHTSASSHPKLSSQQQQEGLSHTVLHNQQFMSSPDDEKMNLHHQPCEAKLSPHLGNRSSPQDGSPHMLSQTRSSPYIGDRSSPRDGCYHQPSQTRSSPHLESRSSPRDRQSPHGPSPSQNALHPGFLPCRAGASSGSMRRPPPGFAAHPRLPYRDAYSGFPYPFRPTMAPGSYSSAVYNPRNQHSSNRSRFYHDSSAPDISPSQQVGQGYGWHSSHDQQHHNMAPKYPDNDYQLAQQENYFIDQDYCSRGLTPQHVYQRYPLYMHHTSPDTDPQYMKHRSPDVEPRLIMQNINPDAEPQLIMQPGSSDAECKLMVQPGRSDAECKLMVQPGSSDAEFKLMVQPGSSDAECKLMVQRRSFDAELQMMQTGNRDYAEAAPKVRGQQTDEQGKSRDIDHSEVEVNSEYKLAAESGRPEFDDLSGETIEAPQTQASVNSNGRDSIKSPARVSGIEKVLPFQKIQIDKEESESCIVQKQKKLIMSKAEREKVSDLDVLNKYRSKLMNDLEHTDEDVLNQCKSKVMNDLDYSDVGVLNQYKSKVMNDLENTGEDVLNQCKGKVMNRLEHTSAATISDVAKTLRQETPHAQADKHKLSHVKKRKKSGNAKKGDSEKPRRSGGLDSIMSYYEDDSALTKGTDKVDSDQQTSEVCKIDATKGGMNVSGKGRGATMLKHKRLSQGRGVTANYGINEVFDPIPGGMTPADIPLPITPFKKITLKNRQALIDNPVETSAGSSPCDRQNSEESCRFRAKHLQDRAEGKVLCEEAAVVTATIATPGENLKNLEEFSPLRHMERTTAKYVPPDRRLWKNKYLPRENGKAVDQSVLINRDQSVVSPASVKTEGLGFVPRSVACSRPEIIPPMNMQVQPAEKPTQLKRKRSGEITKAEKVDKAERFEMLKQKSRKVRGLVNYGLDEGEEEEWQEENYCGQKSVAIQHATYTKTAQGKCVSDDRWQCGSVRSHSVTASIGELEDGKLGGSSIKGAGHTAQVEEGELGESSTDGGELPDDWFDIDINNIPNTKPKKKIIIGTNIPSVKENDRSSKGFHFSSQSAPWSLIPKNTSNNSNSLSRSSSASSLSSPRRGLSPPKRGSMTQAMSMYRGGYGGSYSTPTNYSKHMSNFPPRSQRQPTNQQAGVGGGVQDRLAGVTWSNWRQRHMQNYNNVSCPYIDSHCHIDFLFQRCSFKGTFIKYRELNKETWPPSYEGCVTVFCNPHTFKAEGKQFFLYCRKHKILVISNLLIIMLPI